MPLKIGKAWNFGEGQDYRTDTRLYNIYAAIQLAENLEVRELVIADMNISYRSPCHDDSLRCFVQHAKMVQDADLNCPILINEDGTIIDGRHRLIKAILEGAETIKAKRFEIDPPACYTLVNNDNN